jgi:transglutaminase-like putative cysteine protease
VRLQRWFREDGNFTYTLAREPGNGSDDLVAFLDAAGGREGYCEQFAAAMAVMGRTLGIPSRVAVGFLRPQEVSENTYVYSAHDLHAWPEMYFDDVGWVRFEPTPGDRAASVPGYTTGSFDTPEPSAAPTASAPAQQPDDAGRKLRETDLSSPAGGGGDSGGGLWRVLVGGLLLIVLLLAPRVLRETVRRRRWSVARTPADIAEAGWRELRDTALDLRLPWDDAVTLRTRARSLSGFFGRTTETQQADLQLRRGLRGPHTNPMAVEALQRLVRDVELARYSRGHGQATGRSRQDVESDVDTCTEALRAGSSSKRRRSARWLPASLLRNGAWRSLRDARTSGGITLTEPGLDRTS